ncbi:hypothetical protein QBC37DRAFT_435479 [Rhypophila decipiens]|uniref:Transmembrane protein n=1 Tax=Rhypophila decipiens TaxID=261697 RepID=A0AAN7AYG2_9PEZI|nr:hypothetical protein QBC37DRAFT_435479 [Rhypophila decipiens]
MAYQFSQQELPPLRTLLSTRNVFFCLLLVGRSVSVEVGVIYLPLFIGKPDLVGKVCLSTAFALSCIDWLPHAWLGDTHCAWGSAPATNVLILAAAACPLLRLGLYIAAYLHLGRDGTLYSDLNFYGGQALLQVLIVFSAVTALTHISDVLVARVIPGKWAYPVRYSPYTLRVEESNPMEGSGGSTGVLEQLYQKMGGCDLESGFAQRVELRIDADSPEAPRTTDENSVPPSYIAFYRLLDTWTARTNGISPEVVWILPAYIMLPIIVIDYVLCLSGYWDECTYGDSWWIKFHLPFFLALLGAFTVIKFRGHRKKTARIAFSVIFFACSVTWLAGDNDIDTAIGSSFILFFLCIRALNYSHRIGKTSARTFAVLHIPGKWISWLFVQPLSLLSWLLQCFSSYFLRRADK